MSRTRHHNKRHWTKRLPRWKAHAVWFSTPGSWTRLMMNRPHRARTRHMARLVTMGTVDADEAPWPLDKRPHIYYW